MSVVVPSVCYVRVVTMQMVGIVLCVRTDSHPAIYVLPSSAMHVNPTIIWILHHARSVLISLMVAVCA